MAKKKKKTRRKKSGSRIRSTEDSFLPEPPSCNCVLLCDDVVTSNRYAKHELRGIIGTILVRDFPTTIGGYMAYIRLSNMIAQHKITITLDDAKTGDTILSTDADLPSQPDPLGVCTVVTQIPVFRVMREGTLLFSVRAGVETLATSPIRVVGLDMGEE